MAKDYFQDITPPEVGASRPRRPRMPPPVPADDDESEEIEHSVPIKIADPAPVSPRGIRNISAPRSRPRVPDMRDTPPIFGGEPPVRQPRPPSRWWMWGLAILCLAILGGLALFAFRKTTVNVIPKSHDVVFDQVSSFTAFPEASAATGSLRYTVSTSDLEDSEVVQSQGTAHVETKASGSITVHNEYSTASVKLVKDTRFETPEGLIFRTPAEIIIPGKKGTAAGSVSVTIIADKVGEKYNVGPVSRFTLPGLKSSPDMYAKVYAKSTATFTGGFVGNQPAVAPGALGNALSTVRARLENKAHDAIAAQKTDSTIVFPTLAQIAYQDLPNTSEAGGGVRIHERAHVTVPVFPAASFAQTVAASVSAGVEDASIALVPGNNFGATFTLTSSKVLGTNPITFTLSGTAQLVWNVDMGALTQALAGRDQSAFQTIVNGFAGVAEAHARIEPFWKSTFPSNPGDIKVTVEAPQKAR